MYDNKNNTNWKKIASYKNTAKILRIIQMYHLKNKKQKKTLLFQIKNRYNTRNIIFIKKVQL